MTRKNYELTFPYSANKEKLLSWIIMIMNNYNCNDSCNFNNTDGGIRNTDDDSSNNKRHDSDNHGMCKDKLLITIPAMYQEQKGQWIT